MQKSLFSILFLILVCLPLTDVRAQDVEYGVKVDTSVMMIGDQQTLAFTVKSTAPLSLEFPVLSDDFIKGIEIISGPVTDSMKEGDLYIYEQKYRITSFDTGVYKVPPMVINIKNEGFNHPLTTEELVFGVNTYSVDREKGLADIQKPYDTPLTFREILPYLLYTAAGLLLIALLVYVIVKHRKGEKIFVRQEPFVPPYEKALQGMADIKEKELWVAGNEKRFYTELTDVVRLYISEELDIPCMEVTSDQILSSIEDNEHIDRQAHEFFSELLSVADLVKFAKMLPLQDENIRYFDGVNKHVERIHDSVVQKNSEENVRNGVS